MNNPAAPSVQDEDVSLNLYWICMNLRPHLRTC
jgi:hypothetical protein